MSMHVISNVLYIKQVAENLPSELYKYVIENESILCVAHFVLFRE